MAKNLGNTPGRARRASIGGFCNPAACKGPLMKCGILSNLAFTGIALTTTIGAQQSLDSLIDQDLPSLVATYKTLHAAPELSRHEEKTSSFFAERLRSLGYTVTEHVGKYDRPEWTGYGVVAVLKNGEGPTVLVRTDLDALPVDEK